MSTNISPCVAQAATALNLSERQLYRSLAAAREQGLDGLVHGNRGRTPWNKSNEAWWRSILRLVQKRYSDVNDRHLQELLEREHSIRVHPEALRRRLRAASIPPKRLSPGQEVTHALGEGRHAWLQVVRGSVLLNGSRLGEGDGAAVSEESALRIGADSDAEFLLFDLR